MLTGSLRRPHSRRRSWWPGHAQIELTVGVQPFDFAETADLLGIHHQMVFTGQTPEMESTPEVNDRFCTKSPQNLTGLVHQILQSLRECGLECTHHASVYEASTH